jgi:hypothetical protein
MHLLLIAAVRNLPDMPQTILEGVDRSPLHAVYTPFSIILFYEVILLVFAIANSHTGEIAKQYQIMSLIIVRRVFKDIGGFEDIDNWLAESEAAGAVLLDMVGAVAMFVIVTGFTLIRQRTPKVVVLGVFSWFSSIVRLEQGKPEGHTLPSVRKKDSHHEIPEHP